MNEPDRCPDCGAERSAGICPRCLIRLGIDGAGRLGRSSPAGPTGLAGDATTAPSVLDTIAASIGTVPRVLLRNTAPGEEPGPIVRPHFREAIGLQPDLPQAHINLGSALGAQGKVNEAIAAFREG